MVDQKMPWSGVELKSAREALGMSMVELSTFALWKQTRVSEAERGVRTVPKRISDSVRELENIRDDLADKMIEAMEADPEGVIIVHTSNNAFWREHPELRGVPAVVQRVAAALAAAEIEALSGDRPRIVAYQAMFNDGGGIAPRES